jgi:hypothetical protein
MQFANAVNVRPRPTGAAAIAIGAAAASSSSSRGNEAKHDGEHFHSETMRHLAMLADDLNFHPNDRVASWKQRALGEALFSVPTGRAGFGGKYDPCHVCVASYSADRKFRDYFAHRVGQELKWGQPLDQEEFDNLKQILAPRRGFNWPVASRRKGIGDSWFVVAQDIQSDGHLAALSQPQVEHALRMMANFAGQTVFHDFFVDSLRLHDDPKGNFQTALFGEPRWLATEPKHIPGVKKALADAAAQLHDWRNPMPAKTTLLRQIDDVIHGRMAFRDLVDVAYVMRALMRPLEFAETRSAPREQRPVLLPAPPAPGARTRGYSRASLPKLYVPTADRKCPRGRLPTILWCASPWNHL